ncbi:MAG: NADH-quinone oxidoreductase subunit H [Desulfovibrio sp.]|jgi:formate hydrogenlyase subunit 4/hydrogenase-4 membrane subunit HyfE|nr:NADH-quinone oxidoreductase subunit H [Desulfovibrio sp.]
MTAQFFASLGGIVISLLLAPLLPGVINRVKARVGGRKGSPLAQLYFDLRRLLGKSPVYPEVTTLFFKAAPVAGVAGAVAALTLLPFGGVRAPAAFPGDFVLLSGLFAMSRFFLILAALDTGSAFEGMGASREAFFSALAEPIFLFCLFILCLQSQQYSLSGMATSMVTDNWMSNTILAFSLFLLLLPENSRIPADDPNTHLELTMIHEVILLDHSGPDLAFLKYAAALKLWIFSLIIAGLVLPVPSTTLFDDNGALGPLGICGLSLHWGMTIATLLGISILVGFVESLMARLRMERVPQILTMSGAFAGLAALALMEAGMTGSPLGILIGLIVISDFCLLGAERLRLCIRLIAGQGMVLGLIPLLTTDSVLSVRIIVAVAVFFAVKAIVLPWFLWRTYKKLPPQAPGAFYLGNTACVLLGLAAFVFSLWLNARLGLAANQLFSQIFPIAFATIFSGLLLIISRRMALAQIFGYLVMENGVYLLGMPMAQESSIWLELSILMDILVAAFVMGIALTHLNRAFDSTDVERFATLKD